MTLTSSRDTSARPADAAEPLVSVMMLTYNHAPYIRQAIESVLAQETDFPYELVIGEDCSTDGTRDIVFDYADKYPDRVRVVTADANVGAKENSYRTLRACRGRYLAQCEGDDYWHHPQKLQKQIAFLEAHPDYGMVHSGYDVHSQETGKTIHDFLPSRHLRVPENPDLCTIIVQCRVSFRIQTCTTVVRRDLYLALADADPFLYKSNHFRMGDTQLWAELATVAKIGFIPDSLATYRLLGESASRSRDRRKEMRFELSHADMLLYLCKKHAVPLGIRESVITSWQNTALRLAFHEGNARLAAQARFVGGLLSIRGWLFYFGARSRSLNSTLLTLTRLRDFLFPRSISA